MKLKVMGICSIAALLCGENVFARDMVSALDVKSKLGKAVRKNQNVGKFLDNSRKNYMGTSVDSKSPKSEKEDLRVSRRDISGNKSEDEKTVSQNNQNQPDGHSGVNTPGEQPKIDSQNSLGDQSSDREKRTEELKRLTKSVSVENIRRNFENPELKRSSSLPDIRKVEGPEAEKKDVSNISNVQVDESNVKNVVVDDKSEKSLHSFRIIKEFVQKNEEGFSNLEKNIEEFKEGVSSYEKENQKLSLKDRIDKAEDLSKRKEKLISTLDKNIANFEHLQEILKDLKIDEKVEKLKDHHEKIKSLLKNIDITIDDMKRQMSINQEERRQRKAEQAKKKQEAAQKRLEKEQNKRASVKTGPVNWIAINDYYYDNLSKFAAAAKLHNFRHSVMMKYGKTCLEDQDGSLFDPGQKVDPRVKGLFAQIYEVRFPEAIAVWSEIKNMDSKDPNYQAKLEELRSKIGMLDKNVASLVKQATNLNLIQAERMKEVRDQTQNVVSEQLERHKRMENVKSETQDVDVRAQVEQRERMKEVRDQTKDVHVKEQAEKFEAQGQSKTDQLVKEGLNHPLNSVD